MARYTGANCKLCRREGCKLYLKGDRCTNGKCVFDKKDKNSKDVLPLPPGQHGATRKKVGEYGRQLREKQKARRYYGVLEGQFKHYYELAEKMDGITGANLLILLERRLDNVVYRMGMAASRKEARQLVLHAHFTLNGKKVTIPSLLVKAGDVIAVKESSKESVKIKALAEAMATVASPKWLEKDAKDLVCKVVALPQRDYIDFEFNEQLIVELYSK
ncbi:MAG: 30S ribosomal protein S4 [Clostridia bacterium]|nr:30S ribosomal protein S4 [Clostridia bacterium]